MLLIKTKPWVIPGLVYSIKIKNKLYKSFCKANNPYTIKIMKDNSKRTINLYLHYLGRQKNLITNNTFTFTY